MKPLLGPLAAPIVDKTPVSYAPKQQTLNLATPHRNDTETQMRAMGTVGTVFAIVDRIATAVSQVNWHLYRKARSGLPEDRTEVTSHLALDIWNQPNEFFTRQEFIETFCQHLELTGEGWWVVGRDARAATLPLTLWPVRPDRMAPEPSATEFLTGYTYTGPDGEKIPLTRQDVVFLRRPSPLDAYRGISPVQAISVDLDAKRYAAQWNRNFFVNSAEPGGIIEVPERLSDPQFDEMTARWREQHQGVANAHRVAVIEQGKWVDRKYSMRDMEFVELRNVSREEIREAWGFPKPMLGAVDDVNRANAEAAEVVFARWLAVPRLERIKGALNNDYLKLFGSAAGLEFDYDSPVPEDLEAEDRERRGKAEVAKTLIVDCGFAPAEVLQMLDLPALAVAPKPEPPALLPGMAPAASEAMLNLLALDRTGRVLDTWRALVEQREYWTAEEEGKGGPKALPR